MFKKTPGLRIYATDPTHMPTETLGGLNAYGVLIVFETGYLNNDYATSIYKSSGSNTIGFWNPNLKTWDIYNKN